MVEALRRIIQGLIVGQDVGAVASPSHDIGGAPGAGRIYGQTAGWSPDSQWFLASGGGAWSTVPAVEGYGLPLPLGIGSMSIVLDGWKP